MRTTIFFLVFLFILTPVLADTEVIYAADWTSSVTIGTEPSAYGAFDDATASFSTFTTDGQVATAAVIDDTTASGTFNSATYEIRMSSPSTWDNDYFTVQYFDSGTGTWHSNVTNLQPGSALTTFGPYAMPQIGSFTEVNGLQVRILFERVTSADNIVMNIDGVAVTVDYTPDDLTGPSITFNSPGDNTWDLDGTVLHQFTPTDSLGIANCSVWIDGVVDTSNSTITNGGINNITTSLADGSYLWMVSCVDNSPNNNVGYTSVNRTIRVDTTGPQVNLENPPDNNISSLPDVTFFYNVSDAQTTIASCELITNDTVRDTDTTITEDASQNFPISLTNGFYQWWVNCTDANGFESQSAKRNITINATVPIIVSEFPSYVLNDTVLIEGENFNNSVGITINYTLSNGSVITDTTTSTGTGIFTDTLYLNYSFPRGTYTVFAYETNDLMQNATTTFNVAVPPSTLIVSGEIHKQGDEINMTGLIFPESTSINVTLTFNDTSTDSFLTTTNNTGGFLSYYNVSYDAPLELTTVRAFSVPYPYINATDNFTIVARVAEVTTDQVTYGRDDNVNIFGFNFTRLDLVTLAIYDNLTNAPGPTFPVNKSTSNIGGFAHIWNVGDACNGIYRVEANDTVRAYLNDSAFFTIDETIQNSDITHITSGFTSSDSSAINISLVNSTNNQDESQTLGGGGGATPYYELNFTNAYSDSLQIVSVAWTLEHAETTGFTIPQLLLWNGSAYNLISCPSLSTSTTDVTQTCDITSEFTTPGDLDLVSLRFQLTKTGGGSQTSTVDYTFLNITTSYEPSCTYFNGSSGGGLGANPPIISAVVVDDNFPTPANEIDLNAGATKNIVCNVTASDGDGFGDISGVNATFFSDTVSVGSPDNNQTHYTNASCIFVAGAGNAANYTCGFDVYYYALNGSWTCSATAFDTTDESTATDTATINALYALNVSTQLIDYGAFQLGQQSTEQVVNVSNIGNSRINVSAYGYGVTPQDALAMNCTQNNISISSERYALTPSVGFESKNSLTEGLSALGLLIDEQETPGAAPSNQTYWQLDAPESEQPQGDCAGFLVFQAEPE